jgi:coenzyme F420-reducing hydrogenase alpha subunit
MSTVHAIEDAFGIQVEEPIRQLRRLIYCGEWIESHTLHIVMLHAPDFLGYEDAIQMAKDHPEIVQRGLQLKKTGNELLTFMGGREIHPINVKVGGFYKVPTQKDLLPLMEKLKWAREAALETVRWTATLPFPDIAHDYEFVALHHPDEYPFNEGRLLSNKGLNIHIRDYEQHFSEEQVPYSNALHSVLRNRAPYFVGPMARYNINFENLSPLAQQISREAGLSPICTNPFQSIIIRSIEVLYACDEALRIMEDYEKPNQPAAPVSPQKGTGYGCTEAPRGTLYHRFQVDDNGMIRDAKIVPPTSQNQKIIESDLKAFVEKNFHLSKEKLTYQCEQSIRNYDPCISCSTHFLKLNIDHLP